MFTLNLLAITNLSPPFPVMISLLVESFLSNLVLQFVVLKSGKKWERNAALKCFKYQKRVGAGTSDWACIGEVSHGLGVNFIN